MGSDPPLVSIRTSENISVVSILTDATCAMWIVSSCRPIHRGLYWTTLDGVIRTCVGNRWLPELRRLARKTSPGANGRPFRHTIATSTAKIAPAVSPTHQVASLFARHDRAMLSYFNVQGTF